MLEETFKLVVRVCSWIIVVSCFLSGFGFLIFPKAMVRLNRALNRSFFAKVLVEAIEKPIDIDQWIIGHRIVVGIVALVVSIVFFLQLVT